MTYDVFISYRRSDHLKAERLHHLLKQRGLHAWYDALLAAGEDWRTETAKVLVEAPVFVLLFSNEASRSDEIIKELSAATFHKKIVIPVRIENIRPEGAFLYELASRNWFDAFEETDARLEVLADQLAALGKRAAESTPAGDLHTSSAVTRPKNPGPVAIGVMTVAALALGIGFLIALKRPQVTRNDEAGSRPVAFFGFTATDDDPLSKNIAAIATDETFANLAARHVDTLARGDTAGPFQVPRLTRAGELGAAFALSGEVRRDGALARFTMRLEDVPRRSTLWEGTAYGATSTPVPTAFAASDQIFELTDCVSTAAYTGESGLRNVEVLPLVATACGALIKQGQARFLGLLREILLRGLGGPDTNAAFAFFATSGLNLSPPAQRKTLLTEAEESLARAVKMQPDSYATATAQHSLASIKNGPPLEWIGVVERSLRRAPKSRETYWYSRANRRMGSSLIAAGRLREAAGYLKAASEADPITNANVTAYAIALAASGQVDTGQAMSWDARIEEIMRNRPDVYSWEFGLAASIFSGRGNTERLFELAPAAAPAYVVTCYRDLYAAMKLTGAPARLAAAKKAEACLTEFDSPHMIVQAASMLGDLDDAFARIDTPDQTNLLIRYYYAPWFMPSTRAMRADSRFLPLMEKLGYVDFWRQTRTRPDVCATGAEKGIPLCRALAGT